MNSAELLKYLKNPDLLNTETLPVLKKITEKYTFFQLGWALYLKNLKNTDNKGYVEMLPVVALRVNDRKGLNRFLNNTNQVITEMGSTDDGLRHITDYPVEQAVGESISNLSPAKGNMSLIENFLANGATFKNKPSETAVANMNDMAEKAVTENDEILTETFANLLWQQGYLIKAQHAFEKLSLKFPEKSIYFATRIEEIKKIMNL